MDQEGCWARELKLRYGARTGLRDDRRPLRYEVQYDSGFPRIGSILRPIVSRIFLDLILFKSCLIFERSPILMMMNTS